MRVAIRTFYFKHTVAQLQNTNIKGTPTKIKHNDRFIILTFFQTVCQSRSCRFVDNTLDFQAGDLAGILRRLALRIIKVRWHSDNRFGHLFAKKCLGISFNFAQNHRRNFFWRVFLAAHLDRYAATFFDNLVRHDV